jgi:DNA-directed RNA polymerase alpha subunit
VITLTLPYPSPLSDEQLESLRQCLAIVELELSGGRPQDPKPNSERAKAAIDRFIISIDRSDEVNRNTKVGSIFNIRTAGFLERNGVHTIGQLLQESEESLREFKNVGPLVVDEIRVELGIYDLYLKYEKPYSPVLTSV